MKVPRLLSNYSPMGADFVGSKSSMTAARYKNQLTIADSYWDYPYNEYNYSYVGEAVDQYGYTTLSWDRLGAGMSDHGDPISFSQAPLQVAALAALTNLLRTGSIPGIESKPTKVVNVGHSFGTYSSQIHESCPQN